MDEKPSFARRISHYVASFRVWAQKHIPPGLRSIAGLILIVFGTFGFLPILGFWMIPLGLLLIWLDIVALIRLSRRRKDDTRQGDGR